MIRMLRAGLFLALAVIAAAADLPVSGWTLKPGSTAKASGLRLEAAAEGSEATLASASLSLKVGELYRLSATVRTDRVKADALARYPTALGACLSMESFPFTNASQSVAGTSERKVSTLFLATSPSDRVQLHLGRNGKATGAATFSDVKLEKVEDVTAFIPMETVRWAGKGFRYEMGGWTFLHIEGAPYARGRQHGELMADEIVRYITKLGVQKNAADPVRGWADQRQMADALFFRKYDVEFLEEMKGIADGAVKAGASFKGRPVDLLDIVTLNSAVDMSSLQEGLTHAPNPLTGRTFMSGDDEMEKGGKGDHCSSFVATKGATKSGRFILTQMFMWNGYTGTEWNVMLDIVPEKGHRLVLQTFAGGIHSGTDWYLNASGLVMGETTVGQTPFNADGTPQSNRIRKAAQYAANIDEAAAILFKQNNGLYTNDWTMADTKTDEGACFLLGTEKTRMWRTGAKGKPADTPGNHRDFIWANNNNRDLEVRGEYGANPENAPADLAFNTWNRDIAFQEVFKAYGQKGFDIDIATRVMATSPINRPHACDAKLTTSEMAEKLVFIAHQGKTTLREKMVGGRWIPDLPGATPHLTHGYTAFSPIWITEKLQAAKAAWREEKQAKAMPAPEVAGVKEAFSFDAKGLWTGTVKPTSDAENWFVSASAAYWQQLKNLPAAPAKAFETQSATLGDLNTRHLWLEAKEGVKAPLATKTEYDRYGAYQIPRIRGLFALHQLRLHLGNAAFAKAMKAVHTRFSGKPASTAEILKALSDAAGKDVAPILKPWLERADLPAPKIRAEVVKAEKGYGVKLAVEQSGFPYPFVAFVAVETEKGAKLERLEMAGSTGSFTFASEAAPTRVAFNAGNDIPVSRVNFWIPGNVLDDWSATRLVYGTGREVEAQRTLALAYRDALADGMTEVLLPVEADAELSDTDLAASDLVVFGGPAENGLSARLQAEGKLPAEGGSGWFKWQGRTYGRPDDGLFLALPNPWNPKRMLVLVLSNSRTQEWAMTKAIPRGLPGWAIYRGSEVQVKGHAMPEGLVQAFKP
ncbi:C45 family autoproteolytic acyltransferase/hydolase [Geothrix sp. PMB-07]|uniref:C45 family autoproteolytic acyltransferase/hydolase n=1 Tax=Geothrix sp. PMB-07 TaxID=3068640 RepID=UPI0027419115|nr:C45 family autoproteolytic acyltransferase/hydolase [Geothrix sp. PMB-07]WLT30339.1 C45 family autoproteolytic acyltransferase/hydrolase [Geothrix sp. PMB-07]